jgi:hypothetical protein
MEQKIILGSALLELASKKEASEGVDFSKSKEKKTYGDIDSSYLETWVIDFDKLSPESVAKIVNFINYIGRRSKLGNGELFLWEIIKTLSDEPDKRKLAESIVR